jgi:ABC-type branched-subunit amino acid transport system ATPase component
MLKKRAPKAAGLSSACSEGLASVMVKHLEDIILGLKRERLSILPVEQHLYSTTASRRSRLSPGERRVVHPVNVGELAQHTRFRPPVSACTEVLGRSACASD